MDNANLIKSIIFGSYYLPYKRNQKIKKRNQIKNINMEKDKFKMEENIPIPKAHADKKQRYPFKGMKVNDSFIIGEYTRANMNKFSAYIHYYKNKYNMEFVQRKTEDGMIRVWRTV